MEPRNLSKHAILQYGIDNLHHRRIEKMKLLMYVRTKSRGNDALEFSSGKLIRSFGFPFPFELVFILIVWSKKITISKSNG